MRLGIKGKQVLGVTSIVAAVVVVLSLLHVANLAQLSLEESWSPGARLASDRRVAAPDPQRPRCVAESGDGHRAPRSGGRGGRGAAPRPTAAAPNSRDQERLDPPGPRRIRRPARLEPGRRVRRAA